MSYMSMIDADARELGIDPEVLLAQYSREAVAS